MDLDRSFSKPSYTCVLRKQAQRSLTSVKIFSLDALADAARECYYLTLNRLGKYLQNEQFGV